MANYNKVILMGNLTRDPELKYTPQGTSVCTFSIAFNEKRKEVEKTHFFDCEAWSKTAELITQYLKKGDQVCVDGRLDYNSWDDQTGNKKSKIKIVVDKIQFLQKTGGGNGDN